MRGLCLAEGLFRVLLLFSRARCVCYRKLEESAKDIENGSCVDDTVVLCFS